jgi:NAD(P)-dependent dehydrogenase (short-subunit alcohol dehydrogenase family)
MSFGLWHQLKVWRRLRIGPVSMFVSFRRAPGTTPGTWRQPQPLPARAPASAPAMVADGVPPGLAVIVGVGTGLGYAIARKLARAGHDLALLTRNADGLTPLCQELRRLGVRVESFGMDATHESDVAAAFQQVLRRFSCPSLVIYSLQEFGPGNLLDVSVPAFESAWRHNCLGAFLVARQVAAAMKQRGEGSIFFVGSTSSIIGREGHLNLAVGKFGQRALAQVLARELWPHGVHVAHVLIDSDIARPDEPSDEPVQSDPDDIALSILALHRQPRTAWSSEIDLRPWNERFWAHC